MDKKVTEFLTKEHVGSLAVEIPGGMHAAALHFSHSDEPLVLYFSTEKDSRKMGGLSSSNSVKAAFVCGLSETDWLTLQMDGEVEIIPESELPKVHKIHYAKHPKSEQYKDDPGTVFLKFTPTWWRYTDYNTKPMTIVTSDN